MTATRAGIGAPAEIDTHQPVTVPNSAGSDEPRGTQKLARVETPPWSAAEPVSLEVFHIDANHIAKNVLRTVHPRSVIIFHDGYNGKGADRTQTVKAVNILLEELTNKGYSFVIVDTLLGVPAYQ